MVDKFAEGASSGFLQLQVGCSFRYGVIPSNTKLGIILHCINLLLSLFLLFSGRVKIFLCRFLVLVRWICWWTRR